MVINVLLYLNQIDGFLLIGNWPFLGVYDKSSDWSSSLLGAASSYLSQLLDPNSWATSETSFIYN